MNDLKPKTVRVTVPVTPEVQEIFARLSAASGMSVGRAMGEWLKDTSDAAVSMTELLESARQQPRLAAQKIDAYASSLTDLTAQILESLGRGAAAQTPPVSNTGGKLPHKPNSGRGGNA